MYRFSKSQRLDFIIPATVLIALTFLFHQTHLDEKVAAHFYINSEWVYRDNFFLEKIMHKGGVLFVAAIIVGLSVRVGLIWKKTELKKQRDYLLFVLSSSLLSIIFIAMMKQKTTLPCPWNSTPFGGGSPIPPLWKMFSSDYHPGHCFPAGHSSAGYAFLSLYFSHTLVYGKRNLLALLPGLILGFAFGVTQQLRGAHYLSHDLMTIFLSIIFCWVTYGFYSFYNKVNEN